MFHKSLLTVVAVVMAVSAFAEEISLMDTTQWQSHYPKAVISKDESGEVTIKNGASFEYKKVFDIDPKKSYTVTFDACTDAPKGGHVSAAFVPRMANGRVFYTVNTSCAPASLTEIVADANVGDKSVKVKDISKFVKGVMNSSYLALNAKADFSDLPTFDFIPVKCPKPVQENGAWVLTLAKPLTKAVKAGTPVRQHFYGSAFYFNRGFRNAIGSEWKTISASKKGVAKQVSSIRFPRGTAKLRVHIFFAVPQNATAKIRNLKLVVAD